MRCDKQPNCQRADVEDPRPPVCPATARELPRGDFHFAWPIASVACRDVVQIVELDAAHPRSGVREVQRKRLSFAADPAIVVAPGWAETSVGEEGGPRV